MSSSQTLVAQDAPTISNRKTSIALWIVQAILALLLSIAGVTKSFQPIKVAAQTINWVNDVPPALVRFIGVSELFAAIGLILPAATRIQPRLTIFAATGIALIMMFAMIFHITRNEFFALPINAAFLTLSVFVAYGRLKWAPIVSRK